MAAGKINLQKASGGITVITSVDGTGNTNLVLPESGTVTTTASVKAEISTGSNLVTSPTGALGYGAGAGGTVTQLTSKYTAVTLNKPCGRIIMNNEALASQSYVYFTIFNNTFIASDGVVITQSDGGTYSGANYDIKVVYKADGLMGIVVKNISASTLSDAVIFRFAIIRGANA